MKKYIMSFSQVLNESIGKGSIIIIKGKSEGEKKKLYATHILGSSELSSGATMLFLSNEFYRIKKEGDSFKAVRVSFSNEDALKKAVNIKSSNTISIVKNNNKTPWHWITLKHKTINDALRAIEKQIDSDNYLVESVDLQDSFQKFYEYFVPKVLRTLFLGTKEIIPVDYNIQLMYNEDLDEENPKSIIEFDIDCEVIDISNEFNMYSNGLNLSDPIPFSLTLESRLKLEYHPEERETYYTPGERASYEIVGAKTKIKEVYVEGQIVEKDPEIEKILNQINNEIIKDLTDWQINTLIESNIKQLKFLR